MNQVRRMYRGNLVQAGFVSREFARVFCPPTRTLVNISKPGMMGTQTCTQNFPRKSSILTLKSPEPSTVAHLNQGRRFELNISILGRINAGFNLFLNIIFRKSRAWNTKRFVVK